MRKMKFLAAALAAASLSVSVEAVYAQTEISGFVPAGPNRPDSKMIVDFFEKAGELSGGTLDIEVFYPGSLGFPVTDLIRHIERNTVQLGAVFTGYYPRELPGLSLILPDGAVTSTEDYDQLIPTLVSIMEDNFKTSWDFEVVGYLQPLFFDHSLFCREPVTTLSELRSRKLRVWTKHQLVAFQSIGVSAQIIPKEELYVALQTGVIDCAMYLSEIAPALGLQEVAKHETIVLPWIAAPVPYVMSRSSWDALDSVQQSALKSAGEWSFETSLRVAHEFRSNVEENRKARIESGFVSHGSFSQADTAEIVGALDDAWESMAKSAGSVGIDVYQKVNLATD